MNKLSPVKETAVDVRRSASKRRYRVIVMESKDSTNWFEARVEDERV